MTRVAHSVYDGFVNRLASAVLGVISAACAVVSTCFGFFMAGFAMLSFVGMVCTLNLIPGSENLSHRLVDVAGAFFNSTINSIKGTFELMANVIIGNDPIDAAPHAFKF